MTLVRVAAPGAGLGGGGVVLAGQPEDRDDDLTDALTVGEADAHPGAVGEVDRGAVADLVADVGDADAVARAVADVESVLGGVGAGVALRQDVLGRRQVVEVALVRPGPTSCRW